MGGSGEIYKEQYDKLFAAIADAVESLEHDEPLAAERTLIAAMRAAEEAVVSAEEQRTCRSE